MAPSSYFTVEPISDPDPVLAKVLTQVNVVIPFRKFPVEIRRMIYSNAIANEELTTNLIAALRPDSLLYNEDLEAVFQEHVFVLSEKSQKAADLQKTVMKRVTKLYLNMAGKGIPTNDVSAYFPADAKIREIGMKLEGSPVYIDHFYNVTKLWFKYFSTVTEFKVDWSNTKAWIGAKPPAGLLGCIRVANKWLKTEGILVKGRVQVKNQGIRTATGDDMPEFLEVDSFTWTWSAGKGNVLMWNS